MNCALCDAQNESYRFIQGDEYSFCIVVQAPLKKGHVLVMPRRHITDLENLDEKESKSLLELVGKVRKMLRKVYKKDIAIHMNQGIHSTQEHLHFHLLPSEESIRGYVVALEGGNRKNDCPEEILKNIKDEILSNS